jgi:sugar (pentulose or hexulose) kinase
MEEVRTGLQDAYQDLLKNALDKTGASIRSYRCAGISAMMHGYLPFDKEGRQLAPFRTWRNNITGEAADKLTEKLSFNIPQRWSIAHLYQAILNGEDHVKDIDFLTTLAGYIHWQLTGKKVLGVGDASGMIPVDPKTKNYDKVMVQKFDKLVAPYGFPWKLEDILPKVLVAGENAGVLTPEGAARLDISGHLKAGIPVCPPEGDAGTGMTATNAVKQRTGNVSAGTSSFSMIVLEKELSKPNEMIDMVTTPDGSLVAMVHCNNCTSDLNAWVSLFRQYQELLGVPVDMNEVFGKLYNHALEGDADCGGLISYNYFSGEPVAGLAEGRPLFVRSANDKFNLANFMRAHLYASVAVLKLGNDVLFKEEQVQVDRITGHGGLFKTKGVGQRVLAAALNSPISVMETAGEGGAYGMALLADFAINNPEKLTLADYLDTVVFQGVEGVEITHTAEDVDGFNRYLENYKACLPVEQQSVICKK